MYNITLQKGNWRTLVHMENLEMKKKNTPKIGVDKWLLAEGERYVYALVGKKELYRLTGLGRTAEVLFFFSKRIAEVLI